jgi:hypothetical protein
VAHAINKERILRLVGVGKGGPHNGPDLHALVQPGLPRLRLQP